MQFDVLTLFPEMIKNGCSYSIINRAIQNNIIKVNTINFREFAKNKHKKVDDKPYGGGAGMVLMPQPLIDAYKSIFQHENCTTILFSPQGQPLEQNLVKNFSRKKQLILICGHYEGFDERIKQIINPIEISLGDFILTGGELPALCLIDAVSRFIEGTLHSPTSSQTDSFSDGLLEYPQYTYPRKFDGLNVPDVLLCGNHSKIETFRKEQQILVTKKKRPDLYKKFFNKN